MTLKPPLGKRVIEPQERNWKYAIQGNVVKFTSAGTTYRAKIVHLGGVLQALKGPDGEILVAQGSAIRKPAEAEEKIIATRAHLLEQGTRTTTESK